MKEGEFTELSARISAARDLDYKIRCLESIINSIDRKGTIKICFDGGPMLYVSGDDCSQEFQETPATQFPGVAADLREFFRAKLTTRIGELRKEFAEL